MKQGRASSSGSGAQKPTMTTHKINPGAVAQIGAHVGRASAIESLHRDRGVTSPAPKSVTIHKTGSQRG